MGQYERAINKVHEFIVREIIPEVRGLVPQIRRFTGRPTSRIFIRVNSLQEKEKKKQPPSGAAPT